MRTALRIGLVLALLPVSDCRPAASPTASVAGPAAVPATLGALVGEVTDSRAVVWTRCDRPTDAAVECRTGTAPESVRGVASAEPEHDLTARVVLQPLQPAHAYRCTVRCGGGATGAVDEGAPQLRFVTAPTVDANAPVQFAWGGDVGGQNVCRDRTLGYPIFHTLTAQHLDFFIALGDMIYADDPCRAVGRYGNQQRPGPAEPATTVAGFWAAWRYNREDPAFQSFVATTPYYAVWDDHEVANDFGPHHDTGLATANPAQRHLLPLGLQAFLDYNPFPPDVDTSHRLYRTVRWGRHVELFLLDLRQYRDSNAAPDTGVGPKSMLGAAQRAWLEDALRRSDATWKIIVTSVPLVIPTGDAQRGRDGWANADLPSGFERELLDLLRFLQRHRIRNHLWISTDVHFSAVFRHTPFADDPSFQFYEVETGPLNAGVFPKQEYDPTLRPQRLFLFPPTNEPGGGFPEAMTWFTFGAVRIDRDGVLTLDIVNTPGQPLFTLRLPPSGA